MNLTPAHLHLLLNHFPTIGFLIGLSLLVGALIAGSEDLKRTALVIFVGIALLTIPTYLSGNAAERSIQRSPGISTTLIQTHEGAALVAFTFMEITGALAWLGLLRYRRIRHLSRHNLTTVLLFALVTMQLVARAATIGGEIRHPEIQTGAETVTFEGSLARSLGTFVESAPWVWPTCETLHFIGLSLLIGVVLVIDLRMLGVMKQVSFRALDRLLPWAILGFGINLVTGMMFFVGASEQYTDNVAFYWKIALLMLAGANALYFTAFDKSWNLEPGSDAPPFSKFIAASAMVLWIGVMYFGSMLPFIGNAF